MRLVRSSSAILATLLTDRLALTILAGGLVLRVLLALITPALYAPDESGHLLYIHAVGVRHQFPPISAYFLWSEHTGADEFHQPPLFYILASPLYLVGLGHGAAPVYLVRGLNVLLGMSVAVLSYVLGKLVFPASPAVAVLALAIVSLLPSFAANSATVNNDVLSVLLASGVLLAVVHAVICGQPRPAHAVAIALCVGLGLWTKVSVLSVLPAVALAAFILWRRGAPGWGLLPLGAAIGLAAVMPWWLLRNLEVYGDLLGVNVGEPHYGSTLIGRAYYVSVYLLTSTFAVFGRFNEVRTPAVMAIPPLVVTVLAFAHLPFMVRSQRVSPVQRQAIVLLVLTVLVAVGTNLKFALDYLQGQGRHLFIVLPAAAVLAAAALCDLWRRRQSAMALAMSTAVALYAVAALTLMAAPAFRRVTTTRLDPLGVGNGADFQAGDFDSWVAKRTVPYRYEEFRQPP